MQFDFAALLDASGLMSVVQSVTVGRLGSRSGVATARRMTDGEENIHRSLRSNAWERKDVDYRFIMINARGGDVQRATRDARRDDASIVPMRPTDRE